MQKSWKFKTGIFFIVLSTTLFVSLAFIPFLNLAGKAKMSVSTITLIMAELTFWIGGFMMGKEVFNKYKKYLNPITWFKKKTEYNTISGSEKETTLS
jgi:hypothetical protein